MYNPMAVLALESCLGMDGGKGAAEAESHVKPPRVGVWFVQKSQEPPGTPPSPHRPSSRTSDSVATKMFGHRRPVCVFAFSQLACSAPDTKLGVPANTTSPPGGSRGGPRLRCASRSQLSPVGPALFPSPSPVLFFPFFPLWFSSQFALVYSSCFLAFSENFSGMKPPQADA